MSIDFERLKRDRAYWDECGGEGATHYCTRHHLFGNDPNPCPGCITRPEPAAEWDSGLPPVGTICEFRSTGGSLNHGEHIDWLNCEVIATTRAYAILRHIGVAYSDDHECSHNLRHIEFRPIRTKAERDREELELEITKALRACHVGDSDKDAARRVSDAILTAGWQKPN